MKVNKPYSSCEMGEEEESGVVNTIMLQCSSDPPTITTACQTNLEASKWRDLGYSKWSMLRIPVQAISCKPQYTWVLYTCWHIAC